MYWIDRTFETAASNVAFDEALLEKAESDEAAAATVLRLWEPSHPAVVLGRSSKASIEVNRQRCKEDGVPIIRRCSGGATILTAPGCLMYAVLLDYESHPELRMLDEAHRFVMTRIGEAIQMLNGQVVH